MMVEPKVPSRNLVMIAAPLGYFAVLTFVVTWPLLLHLADLVPGWYVADNYEYLWKMWWFKHAIVELRQTPLVAPHIFYPHGFSLAHAELTPLHTVVGLPLTILFSEVFTYNIFALLSFVLSGYATYLIVHRWTGNPWAGLIAGTLYALNPYHVVRYGGILPLMSIEGIPIFFLGLDIWADERRIRWVGLSILGFLLAAWASIYYAFALLLLGLPFVVIRLLSRRDHLRERRTLKQIALLAAGLAIVVIPLGIPYWRLGAQATLEIPLSESDYWSASPTDYLAPAGLHPLWGEWVRGRLLGVPGEFPQIAWEFVLGFGFVGLLFALYGWRRSEHSRVRALLFLLSVSFVLSLGLTLHIGRHQVILPAPDSLVTLFHRIMNSVASLLPTDDDYSQLAADGLTIPLPALFLRWLIPPLEGMRAWNRFAALTSLAAALLAGLGYNAWIEKEVRDPMQAFKGSRRETMAGIVILGLVVFELWPQPIPLQSVEPRPVDIWLARQPEDSPIMQLPLTSALSAPQMMYSRYHGKPITFAYGTFFPYWYRESFPELSRCPDPECLELLRKWGVKLILINLSDTPSGPELDSRFRANSDLIRVVQIDKVVVYRLTE